MRLRAVLPLLLALALSACIPPHVGASNFSSWAGPNLAMADLLLSKTDFVIADINNQVFIGADGSIAATETGLPAFDFRPYRSLYLYVYLAGLTGGSSPKSGAQVWALDAATSVAGGAGSVGQTAGQTIASGGTMTLMGEAGATVATNTGVAGINGNPVTYSYMPLFGKLQLEVSGSPTGLTAPGLRVFLYGKR